MTNDELQLPPRCEWEYREYLLTRKRLFIGCEWEYWEYLLKRKRLFIRQNGVAASPGAVDKVNVEYYCETDERWRIDSQDQAITLSVGCMAWAAEVKRLLTNGGGAARWKNRYREEADQEYRDDLNNAINQKKMWRAAWNAARKGEGDNG